MKQDVSSLNPIQIHTLALVAPSKHLHASSDMYVCPRLARRETGRRPISVDTGAGARLSLGCAAVRSQVGVCFPSVATAPLAVARSPPVPCIYFEDLLDNA